MVSRPHPTLVTDPRGMKVVCGYHPDGWYVSDRRYSLRDTALTRPDVFIQRFKMIT